MSRLRGRVWMAFAAAFACAGCSKPASGPPPASTTQAASAPAPAAPGAVAGKVANLAPGTTAFVFLQAKTPRAYPPPAEQPVMDQIGQTFGPPILFVRTGHPVEFRNSDDTLHNVHVTNEDTREGAFNVAIPTGNSYHYTFERDGFYHVGCDIHPAMSAEIVSTSTPYATVAEADGSYAFDGVAPGAYTLTIYTGGQKTESDIAVRGPQSRGTPSPE